ncbi:hypothetical protein M3B43_11330 [Nesterenkonia massiliensis]|uniref:CobW C-terminal domain-containing protein n=1 Tax=Nesterenkonia massiliensis TaxID=1232429 RepID=A0ABT2HT69_9MICC|nr:hypothetical protein [Nesterenkonia massiliensis]MCT1607897.1 hypothetical protein [Nesterenkonia massiliensis]
MPLNFDHQISDPDEVLAFGQDLVVIGLDLDHEAFLRALDDAVLSDHELAAGPFIVVDVYRPISRLDVES